MEKQTNDTHRAEKILAAIAARGWCSAEIYPGVARELLAAGKISRGNRYTVGGNQKPVWVAPAKGGAS